MMTTYKSENQLRFGFLRFWVGGLSDVGSRPIHLRKATLANWKKWHGWKLDEPSLSANSSPLTILLVVPADTSPFILRFSPPGVFCLRLITKVVAAESCLTAALGLSAGRISSKSKRLVDADSVVVGPSVAAMVEASSEESKAKTVKQ